VTKVPFSEDHDMIDAFPSDRANQPFGIGILPWRPRRSWSVANTHGAHAPGESLTIDLISIPTPETLRSAPGKQTGRSTLLPTQPILPILLPLCLLPRSPCRYVSRSSVPYPTLQPSAHPKGDDWLHEPKWDGFRFLVIKDGGKVRLYSRHGAELVYSTHSIELPFALRIMRKGPPRVHVNS
jgi:ATP dependent DNA ligase domain